MGEVDAYVSDARLTFSAPRDDMTGWIVHLRNGGNGATTARGHVVCIAKF